MNVRLVQIRLDMGHHRVLRSSELGEEKMGWVLYPLVIERREQALEAFAVEGGSKIWVLI